MKLKPTRSLFVYPLICSALLLGEANAQTSVYAVGNSFSDHIRATPSIALSLGESFDWGRHMIPGAGLKTILDNPDSGIQEQGFYDEALPNKAWHTVSLQPWDESVARFTGAAIEMAELAFQGNPDARIVVLATSSLSRVVDIPSAGIPGEFHHAFENADNSNTGSRAYFEESVDVLRSAFPGKTIGLIPIQHTLAEIDRRLAAGETIPEVSTLNDLLDESRHFGFRGRYLACLVTYATVMQKSPVGAASGNFYSIFEVSQEFAEYAQQLAWDIVSNEDYAKLITDGGLPRAIISADKLRGAAPLEVQFSGAGSTDSDGTLVSYTWDIGGQAYSGATPPPQTFAPGVYPVSLTVTDNDGKSNTTMVYVQASAETSDPISLEAECATIGANWMIVENPFASLGRAVTPAPGFNNTSNTTAPSGINDRVTFSFEVPVAGNYTLSVRVNAPTSSSDSFWVRVNGGSWTPWNNVGNRTANYDWDSMSSTHFLPAGPATVDFAYRENGTVLDKIQLSLTPGLPSGMGLPGINCEYDDDAPSVPADLAATDLKVNGVTLSWTPSTDNVGVTNYRVYRDGQLVGTPASASFTLSGLAPSSTYSMTVAAVDAAGNISAVSEAISVTTLPNNAPNAVITASATEGEVPLTVTFSGDTSTDPDPGDVVIGFEWDFGDGPEDISVNEIEHTFETAGRYAVTLTVIDLFGVEDSTTMEIIVRDSQALLDWRQFHFGTTANSGTAADTFDANNNGVPNLIEFALGRNPTTGNASPPLVLDPASMTLRFFRAQAGMDYVIEQSTDLSTWTPWATNPGESGTEVELDLGDLPTSQFFRLRVSEL